MLVTLILLHSERVPEVFSFDRPVPDAEGFHHYSSAKFCPWCHSAWALVTLGSDRHAYPDTVPCEDCVWDSPHKWGVPGSLLERGVNYNLDWNLLDHLPEALLRRELELTIRELEKEKR